MACTLEPHHSTQHPKDYQIWNADIWVNFPFNVLKRSEFRDPSEYHLRCVFPHTGPKYSWHMGRLVFIHVHVL